MKIFSFPHVVIYELMKQFEPVELIKLSFCSRKAHAVVKTFSKVEEDVLTVQRFGSCGREYAICFLEDVLINVVPKNTRFVTVSDLKTANEFVYGFYRHKHFFICCEDVVQGFQTVTNYVCDLLKVPVSTIYILYESDVWMLDFAEQRQEQRLKRVYACDIHAAEAYSKVMSCNATQLIVCGYPPGNYRFDGKLPTAKHLHLPQCSWMSREQLLGLECQFVQLGYNKLQSSDINALLRSWLNGGLANLKYFKVMRIHINDRIYEGIRDRLERVQGNVTYKVDCLYKDVGFDTDAFHIRREDNIVATVKVTNGIFIMVVWPDMNGNHV